jgi:CysZ protein
LVANLISSPFNGYFSAALEELLTGEKPNHIERSVKDEVKHALKTEIQKLAYNLKFLIPLLLAVSFLFITYIGQPLIPFIWFAFGAWMFSLEYIDFPMGNYGYGVIKQREEVKKNRAIALGFGSGVTLMTMIPIVNFFAVPVSVAAATKLYVDRFKTHESDPLSLEQQ